MNYEKLTQLIKDLNKDLELASSCQEIAYFERELLVAEEILEKTINKGRE